MPGAGKTIITSIVIHYLLWDEFPQTSKNNAKIGVAYLFCGYRLQQNQKPIDLLASLLKQLVQEQSSIPDGLKDLYDRHKGKRTRPELNEISKALYSVVADYSRSFIIIDALDEYQVSDRKDRKTLLSEIFKLQDMTGANIFATSRFIPDIVTEFEGKSTTLEIRAHDSDLQRYLDGHMSRLPKFVSTVDLQEKIKTEITKAVNGM